MAHKKRKKKKSGGSRRMSGLSISKLQQDDLLMAVAVVGGAVGKKFIDTVIAKQDTLKVEQKTVDGLEILASAALFMFGGNQPILKGLAIGLGSSATVSLLQEMDVLKGPILPAYVPFRPRPALNGVTRTPAVSGGGVNSYGFPNGPGVAGARVGSRRAARFAGAGV